MPQKISNRFVKFWLGLGLFSVLSGCGRPLTRADLTGGYVADYPIAKEKLSLLPDGKFTQQVTIKASSQILVTNGAWTFDQTDKRLIFHDTFLTVLDGFGHPNKQAEPGTAMLPVIRRFGTVRIGEGPTVEYKKQP